MMNAPASFMAAADFTRHGLIVVDQYDQTIQDMNRRTDVISKRIKYRLASGDPSRWFVQTDIGDGGAKFTDKRTLNPAVGAIPTRVEGAVALKALVGRAQFNFYDGLLGQVMPQALQLKGQDLEDMVNNVDLLHAQALWTGTDTVAGTLVGTNTTLEYVSIPSQVTGAATVIASNKSIITAIRRKVAEMMNSKTKIVRPTAIYCNPMVIHFIEEEWQANGSGNLPQVEVVPGVTVSGIRTVAGVLPLVPEVFIEKNPSWAAAAPEGEDNLPLFIVTEDMLEYHHLPGTQNTRIYQMGAVPNLTEDYVAVRFGGLVVKAGDVAHAKMIVQRA